MKDKNIAKKEKAIELLKALQRRSRIRKSETSQRQAGKRNVLLRQNQGAHDRR